METEILELQRDTAKRLDFEDVEMEREPDVLDEAGPPSRMLIGNLDAESNGELLEMDRCIRRRLKSVEDILSNEFEGVIEQERAALVLATEYKNYLRSKRDEYIELSVAEGTLQWLANWRLGDEVDSSPIVDDSEINNKQEEEELERSTEAAIEAESLIKAAVDEVNEMRASIANEYDSLEEFDRDLGKVIGDGGMVTCLDKDDRGPVPCKPSETLQELESSIKEMEKEVEKIEKEFSEAKAAAESRNKQYEHEIVELQAQEAELILEEESMKMMDLFVKEYLGLQRQMEKSNGFSILSRVDGCVDLRLTTYVSGNKLQPDSASKVTTSVLEHILRVEFNRETMDIEKAKLTPDEVPMQAFLAAVQENRAQEALFGPRTKLTKFGSQLATLVNIIQEWLSLRASKTI